MAGSAGFIFYDEYFHLLFLNFTQRRGDAELCFVSIYSRRSIGCKLVEELKKSFASPRLRVGFNLRICLVFHHYYWHPHQKMGFS